MNTAKKAMLVGVGVVGISVLGVGVATSTFATDRPANGQSSLIDAIAKKFNVNKSEVQKVFDEQHATHRAEMKTQREADIKQALTDKKITQEQYDHIVAAQKEIDAAIEAAGDRTSQTTTQRDAIKTKIDALRDWMKAQNITPETIGMKMHGDRGRHGHGGLNKDRAYAENTAKDTAATAQ